MLQTTLRWVALLALVLSATLACGPEPARPAPHLSAIDPASAERAGPAFALTLTGTGFSSGAQVLWNQMPLPTTFVSSGTLTAQVGSDFLRVAEDQEVAVRNADGQRSNTLVFTIPCRLPQTQGAAGQTRARVGAIYFDGWSGPLSNPHFAGLADGTFPGREPLSGWQDGNRCAIEQQLVWARNFGIEFFLFDWFFDAVQIDPWDENLDSAVEIMRSLPDQHGMKYALLYVNQDPYIVPTAADWTRTVGLWVQYMHDAAYVRVNDKPLLMVIDAYRMHSDLGSATAVRQRFDELRATARASGLPGVYIVAGINFPDGASGNDGLFPDLSAVAADGYDAASTYGFGFSVPLELVGAQPFQVLAETVDWAWDQAARRSPVAVIPTAMSGSDNRSPEGDHQTGRPLFWFERTPQAVASGIAAVIDWAEANPQVRPEPPPHPPMILIQGWNELGNGAILVPTVEDGTSIGDGIGAMLTGPVERLRSVLSLEDASLTALPPLAAGALLDGEGRPIANATVALRYIPKLGGFGEYRLAGRVPPDAGQAVVGFRVNSADLRVLWPGFWIAGEGQAQVAVYRMSYIQARDGVERVPDAEFSLGRTYWSVQGAATFASSDLGPGVMLAVAASAEQSALLDSSSFSVSGGEPFEVRVQARIAPGSEASGYFFVAFEDRPGNFLGNPGESPGAIRSQTFPFALQEVALGTSVTDGNGRYAFDLSSLAPDAARVVVRYDGDAGFWPGFVSIRP